MPPQPEFLKLYLDHRSELIAYATRMLGDRRDAEDVVQEAFLKFSAAARDRTISEPLAYLYRIVRNLCLDLQRYLKREQTQGRDDATERLIEFDSDTPSPEREASDRQDLQRLAMAMSELPERTRTALEMHRLGGFTLKEIASHLGVSVGLAHSLVVQGLDHCRDRLYRRY